MKEIDAENIPVRGMSIMKIEKKIENYLNIYHPEVMQKPAALDIDKFLDVSLGLSHGFKPDIITSFKNKQIEARMRPLQKTIQITVATHNKIGAKDGHARYTVSHEGAHVIFHSAQYCEFLINPARLKKRKCETYENAEWQAEHGGGSILMPLPTLIPFIVDLRNQKYEYFQIICSIKETYKVSTKAAQARLNQFHKTGFERILLNYKNILGDFSLDFIPRRF